MRYHFNIRDAKGLITDEEGGEFNDLDSARVEARASARDMVIDHLRAGELAREQRIEITDDSGIVLDSVRISFVID